jgi:hypothetical protein
MALQAVTSEAFLLSQDWESCDEQHHEATTRPLPEKMTLYSFYSCKYMSFL